MSALLPFWLVQPAATVTFLRPLWMATQRGSTKMPVSQAEQVESAEQVELAEWMRQGDPTTPTAAGLSNPSAERLGKPAVALRAVIPADVVRPEHA